MGFTLYAPMPLPKEARGRKQGRAVHPVYGCWEPISPEIGYYPCVHCALNGVMTRGGLKDKRENIRLNLRYAR